MEQIFLSTIYYYWTIFRLGVIYSALQLVHAAHWTLTSLMMLGVAFPPVE
jgi:hypothetical protein